MSDILALWDAHRGASNGAAATFVGDPTGDASNELAGIIRRLEGATEGGRNDLLNWAAYAAGGYVAGGHTTDADMWPRLEAAATFIGLEPGEIKRTINSGMTKGKLHPRHPRQKLPSVHEVAIAAPVELSDDDVVREMLPCLDWHKLWAEEDEVDDYIVYPLIPARRLIALYSAPKVGKSLLMLELAAAVATGRNVMLSKCEARNVLYIDFENDPKNDIRQRLRAMGYRPDDLGRLFYLSFPTLAALDGPRGSDELMAAVDTYGAELVVIDTVSRAVAGDENDNDTWLNFYRNTGVKLKRRQVALVRLDHAGKDVEKGQRGGSAKGGDVDAVWRLSKRTETTYVLGCEMHRMPVPEASITLTREMVDNRLVHTPAADARRKANEVQFTTAREFMDRSGISAADPAYKAHREEGGSVPRWYFEQIVWARLHPNEKPRFGRGVLPADD